MDDRTNGIGFFGLLTVCFVVLKLTGYINWSWWLVLLIPNVAIAIIVICLIIVLLGERK